MGIIVKYFECFYEYIFYGKSDKIFILIII